MSTSLPSLGAVAKSTRTFARDLLERVLSTFLQTLVGGIVITQPLNGSMWYAALAGAVAAALSLLKGLLARFGETKNSASLAKGV